MTEHVQKKSTLRSRSRDVAHTPLRRPSRRRGPRPRPPASRPWHDTGGSWRHSDWRLGRLAKKYRMSSKLSAGLPDEMKLALRFAAWETGLSMSEIVRRLLAGAGL